MRKFLIYLLLSISQLNSYSQDTISVYFEINEFEINSDYLKKLNYLPNLYKNTIIDSVYFIGMADSVGDISFNTKLSEQRANEVKNYCSSFFSDTIPLSIFALGEKSKESLYKNRRVDIVIFIKTKDPTLGSPWECEIIDGKNNCYTIDYDLINNSFITKLKKGRRNYVKLENNLSESFFEQPHYIGTVINGKFNYRRLRWKTKTTGKFWWRKKRKVAIILEERYNQFKIFKVNRRKDCGNCGEEFDLNQKISKETSCKKVEYNLMTNSQYRFNWFKPNKVRVRTPKEYVDLNKTYFESCDENKLINWESKRYFGRKKYYFSKVGIRYGWVSNISSLQPCCDTTKTFDCSIPTIGVMDCGTRIKDLKGFRLKSGGWLQDKKNNYYLGASYIFVHKNSVFEFTGAYLFDDKSYSTFSYDYNFIYLPGNIIKAVSWSSAQKRHTYSTYFSLYAGTELQGKFNTQKPTVFSQDFHLGISFQTVYDEFFAPRLFMQYGLSNTNINSYFSFSGRTTFGVSFMLF